MALAVDMRDIVKIYPETGLRANDGAGLSLNTGEILCLAGENGAGKTTLMKVLYGMERPDAGTISVMGTPVEITSAMQANRLGIGMVHQHFMLVDDFTVAQNITLGKEPVRHRVMYDQKEALRRVDAVIKAHRFSIDPTKRVGTLTVGQKQQVEIVKMLYRDVDILILDEPTAVLTEQEIDSLFKTLKFLAANGKSLILITHKLHEIKAISDRVVIMRHGRMVADVPTASVDEHEISRLMMGQSITTSIEKQVIEVSQEPVLQFEGVSVSRHAQLHPLLDNLSFTANSHEILGFAGVGGNGLGELESVLAGILPISSGSITHRSEDISHLDAKQLRARGLAYVPADRLKVGSALQATVSENLIVADRSQFTHGGLLRRHMIREHSMELLGTYSVKGAHNVPIGTLSGGNIQKVILAREIYHLKDYIVFSEPTWGLDIASSAFVHEQMIRLRDEGAALLLLSSNLDEILSVSDRVLVLCRGAIVTELDAGQLKRVTKEDMGAYMLGLKTKEIDRG